MVERSLIDPHPGYRLCDRLASRPATGIGTRGFDGLAAKFAGRKRAETDRFAQLLRQQAIGAAQRNPTRYELVERIELRKTLPFQEERTVREGMTEDDVNSTIRRVLDQGLPDGPYRFDIFTSKVALVYDHVLTAYGDDDETAYDIRPDFQFGQDVRVELAGPVDVNKITDDVVARIAADPDFAARVAQQLSGQSSSD